MGGSGKEELLGILTELGRRTNEEWMGAVSTRKVEEALFHDKSHQRDEDQENKKFYAIASSSDDYLYRWIDKMSPGAVVLDYACGNGMCAVRAAEAGAELSIGIDISYRSILNARSVAEERRLGDNPFFLQGDCENTNLPDDSIDIAICSGMLHHLDLSYAMPELRRILKPGGKIIVNEALNYNPLIKIYRKLTPHLRTKFESEHIFGKKDMEFAAHFFKIEETRYWHLSSILAVPFRKTFAFPFLLKVFRRIDGVLLSIPGIRLMAWQITFVMEKPLQASPGDG